MSIQKETAMIVVVMGVAGSGKSTIGELLAARLGCGFSDADSFHSPANVEKMRTGIPLCDEDRWPWLGALRNAMDGWVAAGQSHVVACSALRQAYRDILSPKHLPKGGDPKGDVVFVHLTGSPDVIGRRLSSRQGHYMNPALLESQFATLEEPREAIIVDVDRTPAEIVDEVVRHLL